MTEEIECPIKGCNWVYSKSEARKDFHLFVGTLHQHLDAKHTKDEILGCFTEKEVIDIVKRWLSTDGLVAMLMTSLVPKIYPQ